MRKVILDTIISLDGYYTSPKNEIDWFDFDRQEVEWSKEILRRVDTMLYGRVTYEEFSEFWPKAKPSPDGFDPEIIGQLNGLRKVVFSRKIKDAPWKPAEVVRGDPATEVARLKRGRGKDMVVVGSGTLVAALVRGGLVDEYRVRVRPIILGAGRPLFVDQKARHPLKLVSAKAFGNGVVALHYEPVR
ncbi:MAG: dihydrofolate reductase family protein [Nitrososphaerota archaeon]|nr:dihydrofolate reductase family protein [Nitrososphaerota archaeon]MDG6947675.1 dihydrofolate reductase family protein [Nitrososphaerota archaeon]